MKIVKKEVKTHVTHAMCDCGGEFKPTNMILSTFPVQYPHDCNKCGKREIFYERYPKIEYEEEENA